MNGEKMSISTGEDEIIRLLNDLKREEVGFTNADKWKSQLKSATNFILGQRESIKNEINKLNDELKKQEEALEKAKISISENPLKEKVEILTELLRKYLDLVSWISYLNRLNELWGDKLYNAFSNVKGLELANEVTQNTERLIDKIVNVKLQSLEEKQKASLLSLEKSLDAKINSLDEKMKIFVERIRWSDEQFRQVAKIIEKKKEELEDEYEKIMERAMKEKRKRKEEDHEEEKEGEEEFEEEGEEEEKEIKETKQSQKEVQTDLNIQPVLIEGKFKCPACSETFLTMKKLKFHVFTTEDDAHNKVRDVVMRW